MRSRSFKGFISIYLSLLFCVITGMVCSLLNMTRKNVSIAIMDMSADEALISCYSYFDRDLFDEYGILAVKTDKYKLSMDMEELIDENLSYQRDLAKLDLKDVSVDTIYHIKDMDGALFERQVIDTAKYSVPVDAAKKVVDMFLGKKEDRIDEGIEKLKAFVDKEGEFEEALYELIGLVDGPLVKGKDIVDFGEGYVDNNEYFVKRFAKNRSQYKTLNINYSPVYVAIVDKIYAYDEKIKHMMDIYESDSAGFVKEYDVFKKELEQCVDLHKKAIASAEKALRISKELDRKKEETLSQLESERGKFEEKSYKALKERIERIDNMANIDKNEIVDVAKMIDGLKKNLEVLEEVRNIYEYKPYEEGFIDNFKESIGKLSNYGFVDIGFDYTRVHVYGGNNSILDMIGSLVTDGVYDVVTHGLTISGKEVSSDYKVSYRGDTKCKGVEKYERILLFDEYVLGKFSCATDPYRAENSLDYGIEYILYGQNSDRKNLKKVINDLILMRQGFNMTYIFTNPKMMEEVSTFVASMGGGSNIVIGGIAELTLISLWAYGESVVDVRDMLHKKKVPLYKDESSWKLSLEGLVSGNFDTDDETDEAKEALEHGFDYRDYLRILLYMEDYGQKNIATVNLIEMCMKASHDKTFSMSDMVVGSDISIVYMLPHDESFDRTYSYSY